MELLGLLDAAIGAPGFEARVFHTHTAALELIFQQRQMRGDFAIQFAVRAVAAKKIFQLGQ
jgi:hypothetical protein